MSVQNPHQYVPSPMSAEEVAALHDALWMALITIPNHRHQLAAREDSCEVCHTRRYLSRAYKCLPEGKKEQ